METRRRLLVASCASALAGGRAFGAVLPEAPVRLAAAWSRGHDHAVGVLGVADGRAAVLAEIGVPTRAHGLLAEPGGTLLAVARRPGDWLMRWRSDGTLLARRWVEAQRRFNGHLLASRDGRRLFSTETDTDTDRGLIGVRDAASLEKIDEWPTQGLDAHQMLLDAAGHLLVANGGVASHEDSGRLRLARTPLDASLVRLGGTRGELLGRWRLADPWLSVRHLAFGGPVGQGRRRLGIALQAEHPDAAARAAAPVLALFDGQALRPCAMPTGADVAGYGGDIAWRAGRWAVSCPRANALASWQDDGSGPRLEAAVDTACALAGDDAADTLWCGGRAVDRWTPLGRAEALFADDRLRLDNHWLRLHA